MSNIQKKYLLISLLSVIILLGVGLRLYHLGWNSLWYDEATVAQIDINKLAKSFLNIGNTFIFFTPSHFLFFYWGKFFGKSEFVLRLLPAICSIISIYFIFKLANVIFGNKKVGLLSAFLISISPLHIYYSQERRIYSLVVLLSIISVYFLLKALNNKKYAYWIGYVFVNTLNIYIHFSAAYVLVFEITFFLLNWKEYKKLIKRWLLSHLLIFVLIIPWLSAVFTQMRLIMYNKSPFWALDLPSVSWKDLFFTLEHIIMGFNAYLYIYLFSLTIFLALFIHGILKIKKKVNLILLLCGLFVPISTAYLISKFKMCYIDEYLLSSSIFFYVIAANGLSQINSRIYKFAILSVIFALSMFTLGNYYQNLFPRPFIEHIGTRCTNDFRGAASHIITNFQEDDYIFHIDKRSVYPFKYYFERGGLKADNGIILRFDSNNTPVPFRYDIKENKYFAISKGLSIRDKKRIWLVVYSGPEHNLFDEGIIKWLKQYYYIDDDKVFKGIKIYLLKG